MPLLKRKSYSLSKPPDDLKPQELIFQVRFTKEIFRDYEEYLKRINLYRQRVWTCKVTGKTGLTYEEALVSECRATEQVQQFPKEFMGPVLRLVQFSTLRLDELVNMILKAFKDNYLAGEELMCIQGNSVKPCKVLKIITPGTQNGRATFEVGWLDDDKSVTKTFRESADRLYRKKPPFTRALLKSFIRESVSNNVARNAPWMVLEKLCHKYKIAIEPPEELKTTVNGRQSMYSKEENGNGKRFAERVEREAHVYFKRRKKDGDGSAEQVVKLEKKAVTVSPKEVEPIRYPIEDSLVRPSSDDPSLNERPVPSTDFPLPMDCIGRLLMVWNFCVLFGKVVQLYPFSLEECEKAIQCKDGDPVLLREAHHALLQVVLSDPVMHQLLSQKRKRKAKVSFQTWKDDLCDVLELEGFESLAEHSSAIREGKYRLLEPSVKLDILCELVDKTVASSVIREQLDLIIEEKQAIAAQKRKEVKEHLIQVQGPDSGQKTTEASTRKKTEDDVLSGHRDDDQQSLVKSNLIDGTCENGGIEDDSTLAFARLALKAKGGSKIKEEKDKENKRIEEQKSTEKKRHAEESKEQKRQEKKMTELQKRQEQLDREIEKRIIRTNPLGRDRDYNRYWFFPREGRIFVEDQDSKRWAYYGAKEELESLFGSLNTKGIRERTLHRQLEKQLNRISDALQKRSKEIAQRVALEDTSIRRSSRVKSSPHQQTTPVYRNKYRTI